MTSQDTPERAPAEWVIAPRSARQWWRLTTSRARLTPSDRRLERQLGIVRAVVVVAGLLAMWQNPSDVPAWTWWLAVAMAVGMAASAFMALVVLPRAANQRALAELLSLLDPVLLSFVLPFGLGQDAQFIVLIVLMMVLMGGLRLGRFGVYRALVIAALGESTRLVMSAVLRGTAHPEDTAIAFLIAGGLGLIVADVATLARQARRDADVATAETRAASINAQRAAWETEVLHGVLAAGLGVDEAGALQRMVTTVHDHLAALSATVVALGRGGKPIVLATTSDEFDVGEEFPMAPGGPIDRVLSLRQASAATHRDLEAINRHMRRPRGSAVAAPLRCGTRQVAALAVDTAAGDLLHRRDAVLVTRLADAMGPVVDALGLAEPSASPGPGRNEGHDDGGGGGAADDVSTTASARDPAAGGRPSSG